MGGMMLSLFLVHVLVAGSAYGKRSLTHEETEDHFSAADNASPPPEVAPFPLDTEAILSLRRDLAAATHAHSTLVSAALEKRYLRLAVGVREKQDFFSWLASSSEVADVSVSARGLDDLASELHARILTEADAVSHPQGSGGASGADGVDGDDAYDAEDLGAVRSAKSRLVHALAEAERETRWARQAADGVFHRTAELHGREHLPHMDFRTEFLPTFGHGHAAALRLWHDVLESLEGRIEELRNREAEASHEMGRNPRYRGGAGVGNTARDRFAREDAPLKRPGRSTPLKGPRGRRGRAGADSSSSSSGHTWIRIIVLLSLAGIIAGILWMFRIGRGRVEPSNLSLPLAVPSWGQKETKLS